jgi:protein-histidine pros-kinase
MKLLARFNLIFIAIFGIGTILAVWFAYGFLRVNAKNQVMEEARLMMETTLATRSYTAEQIQPLLNKMQAHDKTFLPQTVPAYSATQVFDYLHKRNPDYTYKEATLNPPDLVDRANDWESDVVNTFRNDSAKKELIGERDTATGRSLYYARPLSIESPTCLECHSTPANAPPSQIRQYGSNNGFGWKLHEVIGAQIVSVPEALPIQIADKALRTLIFYFVLVAVTVLVVLDTVLIGTVIRPVARLSRVADEISQGKLEVEELPSNGKDEISILAASFNRMQRSLVRAMKMLENEDDDIA